jgi:hypothetical protein
VPDIPAHLAEALRDRYRLLLGTPADQKRQVISQGGHSVPRAQLVQETLDWLDRYLGPPAR